MNAPAKDLAIIDALDTIERKELEAVHAQIAIAERLVSLRALVRDAAEVLQRERSTAADPSAPISPTAERLLSRLSWLLHEERVQAESLLDHLRRQQELLASERICRLAELTPPVAALVRQLRDAGVRPLVATVRAGRCNECSSEAVSMGAGSLACCPSCRRFSRPGEVPIRR